MHFNKLDLNKLDLTNRRGIITGAGQGIGRALALEFGRRGGHLLLIGRQQATLTETARSLPPKAERLRLWSKT